MADTTMKIVTTVVSLFKTNCYLVMNETTRDAFLIDPGDNPKDILAVLEREQVNLKAIFLTHGHLDHFRGVPKILEMFSVPVYAQKQEIAVLEDADLNLTLYFRRKAETLTGVLPLEDGAEFTAAGFEGRVLHTPGHTRGGCCYYFPKEGILFSGDTLFYRSVGTTDFPEGSMSTLCRSIREKLLVLPDNTLVYPGHGETTVIGEEKRENPFVVYDENSVWN